MILRTAVNNFILRLWATAVNLQDQCSLFRASQKCFQFIGEFYHTLCSFHQTFDSAQTLNEQENSSKQCISAMQHEVFYMISNELHRDRAVFLMCNNFADTKDLAFSSFPGAKLQSHHPMIGKRSRIGVLSFASSCPIRWCGLAIRVAVNSLHVDFCLNKLRMERIHNLITCKTKNGWLINLNRDYIEKSWRRWYPTWN